MVVGVDLDNTLICYDDIFHMAGVRNGLLAADCPRDKRGVRNWLIERGREHDFTRLQAEVYGVDIALAPPYPGAADCLREVKRRGVPVRIVSHKTEWPVAGPRHNLRRAALDWLAAKGFIGGEMLTEDDVFFTSTMNGKAEAAIRLGCTHFIDDLRAFLTHSMLPATMKKIWFAPSGGTPRDTGTAGPGLKVFHAWPLIESYLCQEMG